VEFLDWRILNGILVVLLIVAVYQYITWKSTAEYYFSALCHVLESIERGDKIHIEQIDLGDE
jgi:hypothetical protein